MEGGVAILLLLIIAAVIAALVLVFSGAGGALSLRRRSDADNERSGRPEHTRPTTPMHEHTHLVGTGEDAERERTTGGS
jgi:hypothetical protein